MTIYCKPHKQETLFLTSKSLSCRSNADCWSIFHYPFWNISALRLLYYHSFQYVFNTQRDFKFKSLKYHPQSVNDMFIKSVKQDSTISMFVWIIQLTLSYNSHSDTTYTLIQLTLGYNSHSDRTHTPIQLTLWYKSLWYNSHYHTTLTPIQLTLSYNSHSDTTHTLIQVTLRYNSLIQLTFR